MDGTQGTLSSLDVSQFQLKCTEESLRSFLLGLDTRGIEITDNALWVMQSSIEVLSKPTPPYVIKQLSIEDLTGVPNPTTDELFAIADRRGFASVHWPFVVALALHAPQNSVDEWHIILGHRYLDKSGYPVLFVLEHLDSRIRISTERAVSTRSWAGASNLILAVACVRK